MDPKKMRPSEMRSVINHLSERVALLEGDLKAEQRAYKTLMLEMIADDPEKAEDARQQVEDMKRACQPAKPEPAYVVSIPCLVLGILLATTGDLSAGLLVLAFATVHKENEPTKFNYTLDIDRIKGWFKHVRK